jgi:CheY-like chemotaxis protein
MSEKSVAGDAAKGRFLAHVSHEIRTPMNGVIGMAKLLADTPLTTEQRAYLDAILQSGELLLGLINDLIDYSAIDAGRFEVTAKSVDLRAMMDAAIELAAPAAHGKGLGIGAFIAPDAPDTINADPLRLQQILSNLIGNAVKYTQTGGVSVDCTADGATVRVTIADSGPGIAATDRERIFGEFERVGDKTAATGSGLGLAISRQLARAMGGDIVFSPGDDVGSRFTLSLPGGRRTLAAAPLRGLRVAIRGVTGPECGALRRTLAAAGALTIAPDAAPGAADIVLATPDAGTGGALRSVVLITPQQRGALDTLMASGHEAYLVRPIRSATLMRVLGAAGTSGLKRAHAQPKISLAPRLDSTPPLHVLLAEDNAVNALLVTAALGRAGHRITHVGDGAAALEAIAANRFSLVLMDLHMPVMDGPQAIARLRAIEDSEGRARLPVIVLTADARAETAAAMAAIGANAVIAKPVDPAELLNACLRAVRGKAGAPAAAPGDVAPRFAQG